MTEDFPCSARSSSYTHATANTPARLPGACFAHFPGSGSLPRIDWQVGPCITVFEACSAFTHVAACVLAKSPSDPLHRRLQPFRYLHDCSDCYRPERKRPGGFRTRWKSADFARRTSNSGRLEWLQCKLASNTGFAITQAPGNSLDGSEVRSSAFAAVDARKFQGPVPAPLPTLNSKLP